jgi:hypothetical protein
MKPTVRPVQPPQTERGHSLVVGSTLILAAMGFAMKATAGMRGQTLRELVRRQR